MEEPEEGSSTAAEEDGFSTAAVVAADGAEAAGTAILLGVASRPAAAGNAGLMRANSASSNSKSVAAHSGNGWTGMSGPLVIAG